MKHDKPGRKDNNSKKDFSKEELRRSQGGLVPGAQGKGEVLRQGQLKQGHGLESVAGGATRNVVPQGGKNAVPGLGGKKDVLSDVAGGRVVGGSLNPQLPSRGKVAGNKNVLTDVESGQLRGGAVDPLLPKQGKVAGNKNLLTDAEFGQVRGGSLNPQLPRGKVTGNKNVLRDYEIERAQGGALRAREQDSLEGKNKQRRLPGDEDVLGQ